MGTVPARDPGPGKTKPEDGKMDTHKVTPRKGATVKEKFGAPEKGRHHRSVLGVDSKRTLDGHKKHEKQIPDAPTSRMTHAPPVRTYSLYSNRDPSHFYQLI
jgi:hypothetical protein